MSKKVYVGNLPFKYRDQDLKDIFSKFGEVEDAVVIFDRATRRSKGFGFVTFVQDSDADKAIEEMHEKEADGRPLTVNEARPREESSSQTPVQTAVEEEIEPEEPVQTAVEETVEVETETKMDEPEKVTSEEESEKVEDRSSEETKKE